MRVGREGVEQGYAYYPKNMLMPFLLTHKLIGALVCMLLAQAVCCGAASTDGYNVSQPQLSNTSTVERGGPTIDNCDCGFFKPWCCIDDIISGVDNALDFVLGGSCKQEGCPPGYTCEDRFGAGQDECIRIDSADIEYDNNYPVVDYDYDQEDEDYDYDQEDEDYDYDQDDEDYDYDRQYDYNRVVEVDPSTPEYGSAFATESVSVIPPIEGLSDGQNTGEIGNVDPAKPELLQGEEPGTTLAAGLEESKSSLASSMAPESSATMLSSACTIASIFISLIPFYGRFTGCPS